MVSRQSVIDVLKEREDFYAERNEGKQMFAIANAIDDVLNLPSVTDWHTGTPQEEGWYLLKVKSDDEIIYDTNRLIQCLWGLDWKYVHEEILAWQKINEDEE